MKLRERLLLLLTPLVILPLFFVILFAFFYIEKIAPDYFQHFGLVAFCFISSLTILIMGILVGISNSIVKPIQEVIEDAKQISQGNFDHKLSLSKSDDEISQLTISIQEMQKSLKQQKLAVEEAAKLSALGKITAQIAHDIRSPLAAIKSVLTYFQAQPSPSEDFQEYTMLLKLSASRLTAIAEDLVRQYRGECERRDFFSIHHILDNIIREFSSQKKNRNIIFDRKYHTQDIVFHQDRTSIDRVFTNLIKNAVEAVGIEGKITIQTFLKEKDCLIEIEDNGCGIEKEKIPLIFNDLYTSGKVDGTGIGLAFVKKTIETAQGSVSVRSQLGEGTIFSIRLSIAEKEYIKNKKDTEEKIWNKTNTSLETQDTKTLH